MLKNSISILISCLLSLNIVAQREVNSPMSYYGLGDIYSNNLHANQAIGYTGIGIRFNNHINFKNPASHNAIPKERFIFEIGAGYNSNKISANNTSQNTNVAGIEYYAGAFPVIPEKWGCSIGILPFTSIGYDMYSLTDIAEYHYTASGGVNQFKIGNSFQPVKNLHIGFHFNYLFGNTIYESTAMIQDDSYAFAAFKSSTINSNGFTFDYGIQYTYPVNETKELTFGATFRNKQTIDYTRKDFLAPYQYAKGYANMYVDTTSITKIKDLSTDIPQQIGFGLGYTIENKLLCGIDFELTNYSDNSIYGSTNSNLESTLSISSGVEFTPNYRSSSYFAKLPYRFGIHYKKLPFTYESNGTFSQPIDFGISFGSDLILHKTGNRLSTTCNIGQKIDPTINNSLQETYFMVKLTVTLQERWFFKRKID